MVRNLDAFTTDAIHTHPGTIGPLWRDCLKTADEELATVVLRPTLAPGP
jgi:hypothetical protein